MNIHQSAENELITSAVDSPVVIPRRSLPPVSTMNETGWPQTPDPASSFSPLPGSPQYGQSSQDSLDARLQRLLNLHEQRDADDA